MEEDLYIFFVGFASSGTAVTAGSVLGRLKALDPVPR
jgi:hypothetical protein